MLSDWDADAHPPRAQVLCLSAAGAQARRPALSLMFGWLRRLRAAAPDSRCRLAGHAGALSLPGRSARPPTLERLRALAAEFLRDKEFHGAHGFVITDEVALAIAAQAVLPVLHLRAGWPGTTISSASWCIRPRWWRGARSTDEAGVVHEYDEVRGRRGDGPRPGDAELAGRAGQQRHAATRATTW